MVNFAQRAREDDELVRAVQCGEAVSFIDGAGRLIVRAPRAESPNLEKLIADLAVGGYFPGALMVPEWRPLALRALRRRGLTVRAGIVQAV